MDSEPQHTVSDSRPSNTRGVMHMIQEIQKVCSDLKIHLGLYWNWLLFNLSLNYNDENIIIGPTSGGFCCWSPSRVDYSLHPFSVVSKRRITEAQQKSNPNSWS